MVESQCSLALKYISIVPLFPKPLVSLIRSHYFLSLTELENSVMTPKRRSFLSLVFTWFSKIIWKLENKTFDDQQGDYLF